MIFVADESGATSESWFVDHCSQAMGCICYDVPADKQEHTLHLLINKVIKGGQPDIIFMDAPQAHAQCSFPGRAKGWEEEEMSPKSLVLSSKAAMKSSRMRHEYYFTAHFTAPVFSPFFCSRTESITMKSAQSYTSHSYLNILRRDHFSSG